MSNQQQFGEWKVEKELAEVEKYLDPNSRIYLVHKKGYKTRFVLKIERDTHAVKRIKQLATDSYHPNVLHVVDFSEDPEMPYTVSEYCSYGMLKKFDYSGISEMGWLRMCNELFDGMEYIHYRGFNKMDNNPKNIFLKKQDERIVPVIADLESLSPRNGRITDSMGGVSNYLYNMVKRSEIRKKMMDRRKEYSRKIGIIKKSIATTPYKTSKC